ncbi:MAG: hypothetical protein WC471_00305 [Candidatus Woesearchaeota archaeon]
MNSKKSQITVFIITGLVLLMIFMFIYYITTLTTNTNSSIMQSTQAIIKNTFLNSYVTKCLERTAIDGLSVLGSQGGKIYLTPEDKVYDDNGKKINYGISNMNYAPPFTPPYPFKQLAIPFPYFGIDNLPPLCDTNGPNVITPIYQPCRSYSPINSMQKELRTYVDNYIEKCTKLDFLFTEVDYGIPKTEIIIGDESVIFNLKFPINYTIDNQKFELSDFTYESGVRLKKFHEFIKAVIKNDTADPDFDMVNDYKQLPEYKEGFSIRKVESLEQDTIYADDFASIIEGHAYSLRFIRENRPPIIKEVEIIKTANSITLKPKVADPDEDNMVLSLTNRGTNFIELDDYFIWQTNSGIGRSVILKVHDESGLIDTQEIEIR